MKQKVLILSLMALCTLGMSLSASAAQSTGASAHQEISTAQAHALMASNADSLKMVHAHLQHAINCLVGPGGKAFDASTLNPCNGMGNGALVDSAKNSKVHDMLTQALTAAKQGLQKDSLAAAQQAAKNTANLLGKALNAD